MPPFASHLTLPEMSLINKREQASLCFPSPRSCRSPCVATNFCESQPLQLHRISSGRAILSNDASAQVSPHPLSPPSRVESHTWSILASSLVYESTPLVHDQSPLAVRPNFRSKPSTSPGPRHPALHTDNSPVPFPCRLQVSHFSQARGTSPPTAQGLPIRHVWPHVVRKGGYRRWKEDLAVTGRAEDDPRVRDDDDPCVPGSPRRT
ncbi:hypothetical protein K439DRAFT_1065074 [Ramaria rubella]|nr:hypothetical protein K439DRAFT_1065074 [Ramaria rubella]